jgi:polyisoprenoid-binding protein YceI
MTRSIPLFPRFASALALASILPLAACEDAKKAISGEKEPEAKPVTADPKPLTLEIEHATISVITVKNGDAEVPGKFEGVTGSLTFPDGSKPNELTGSLTIDASSWDSALELRDERVKNTFFEVEKHAEMGFRLVGIDGLPEDGIEIGGEAEGDASGKLTFAGTTVDVAARVKVSRAGDKDFYVDTVEPFVVSIESLGLTGPLKALIEECAHDSVDDSVKVSVRLALGEGGDEPEEKPHTVSKPKQERSENGKVILVDESQPKTIQVGKPEPVTPPKKAPQKGGKGKGKGKGKSKTKK